MKLTDHQQSVLLLMAEDAHGVVHDCRQRAIGLRTADVLEMRELIKTRRQIVRYQNRIGGRTHSYCDVSATLTDTGWQVASVLGADVDAKLRASQLEAIRLSAIWATDRSGDGGPAMNIAEAVRWSQQVAALEALRLSLTDPQIVRGHRIWVGLPVQSLAV